MGLTLAQAPTRAQQNGTFGNPARGLEKAGPS